MGRENPPANSLLDAGAIERNPPNCSCMSPDASTRADCHFLPSWAAGLPATLQDQLINVSTCDKARFAAKLPSAIFSPPLLPPLGIPRQCEELISYDPEHAPCQSFECNVHAWNALQHTWPISNNISAFHAIVYSYQDYFDACAPPSCSYISVQSISATPWLIVVLCLTALHSEIALIKFIVGWGCGVVWRMVRQGDKRNRSRSTLFGNHSAQWLPPASRLLHRMLQRSEEHQWDQTGDVPLVSAVEMAESSSPVNHEMSHATT